MKCYSACFSKKFNLCFRMVVLDSSVIKKGVLNMLNFLRKMVDIK